MSAFKQTENEKAENGMREKPKLKAITADMPKWKQEKLVKENEIIAVEIRKFEYAEREEERKWCGVPGWKAEIMRLKQADQKRREDEQNQARVREEEEKKAFECLPFWRQNLLSAKGVKRIVKKHEETQQTNSNVAIASDNDSADSDTLEADHDHDHGDGDTDEDVENDANDNTAEGDECQDNSETAAENGANSEVAVENEDHAAEDCEQNDDSKESGKDDHDHDHNDAEKNGTENGEVEVPDDDKMEVTSDVTEKN